jgi:hypothetical protein
MEWIEFKLREIVKLSQRNRPSHVILGDDSLGVKSVPFAKIIQQGVL